MRLPYHFVFLAFLPFCACQAQTDIQKIELTDPKTDKITEFIKSHRDDKSASISKGSVSNGKLENGKLMPFSGNNFHYFDTTSFISGRAFVNDKVKQAVISTYSKMETLAKDRHFCLMECSHEHGGKLYPHKTHQNGLSIDFMVPLLREGKPYYELDDLGAQHYFMDFDNSGKYLEDKKVELDFNLIALHILTLDAEARKKGLKIEKVIFKMELKDELFATKYGKELEKSSIYITKSLTPIINALHDDHYHIDFKALR